MDLIWSDPPPDDIVTTLTREEIGKELAANPRTWAVVASHDRALRAASHAERINSGVEYGPRYKAIARQVGREHRVYAQAY